MYGSINAKTIKGMLINKYFDRSLVRASHLWKLATQGIGLTAFKLEETDVHNERNGLSLLESIEKAFDTKKICFNYDPFVGVFRLKILYNRLRDLFVVTDANQRKKFNEFRNFRAIDGAILALPEDVYPYRRILNWHARCSYKSTKRKNWISQDDNFEDFFHLSDLVSLPGDDDDE